MQRRTVIKQLAFVSGALLFIPSCIQDKGKASIKLNEIDIDADQEKLLAELSETILPKTDAPGAKDMVAHLFIMKMVDDCYTSENQERFVSGLKAFDAKAESDFSNTFFNCTASEKEALLTELEAKKAEDDLHFFYSSVKKLTIQAYTNSKFYLTKVQEYRLVPGKFKGCVPIDKFKGV